MASAQCYKTCQETCQQQKAQSSLSCQQKTHQSSFGYKVSDMFKGHHNGATATQTHANSQCHSQCRGSNHHTACSYFHTHTQQNFHGGNNHHIIGANQTNTKSQCHSQCRGGNHHSECSYFRTNTHIQGYGAANNHHNNGCSKSHTHTQSCRGANHHHNNGGGYGMTTKSSETEYFHSETKTTNANRCSNGTSKKEHKSGGMFQKIKNSLSDHSDSSDSESDSDNESKCRRRSSRKNCN